MRKLVLSVGLAGLASGVFSEECLHHHEQVAPYLTVHTDVRVHADQVYQADDPDAEIFELTTHTHVNFEFSPVDRFFVRAALKLEGGESAPDGKNRYFENHALMLEELKLVYAPGPWEVFAGKFNPKAGLDQHDIPGFYGYEIEEEYSSILGRLGTGAAYTFETGRFGNHRLEASGFFRDTTVLNQTLINSGGEPDSKQNGGTANTHDFSSWAAALSGDLFYTAIGDTLHDMDYVLAYAREDAGYGASPDSADEERGVVGGVYTATLTENLQIKGVGEFKSIKNSQTNRGEDLLISTAGSGLYYKGWELGGSYSFLDSNAAPDGQHIQASLGYTWRNGLGIAGGWKLVEEDDEQSKSLGLMLSYHGDF
jgi:hypothetical protein